MEISKALLRKTTLEYRRILDQAIFEARNNLLSQQIVTLVEKEKFKTVHCFFPIEKNREPDIRNILPDMYRLGCKVVVSKTNFSKRTLRHYYLEKDTVLEKNRLGIPEPVNAIEADLDQIDLILVPLAVGDKEGNRIGYGGGFYDRFLNETKARKIGLSLSPLLDRIHQTDDWDERLDEILIGINQ